MSGNGSPDDGNVVPAGGVGSTLNSQAGNEGPDVGSYGLSTGAIVGICVAIGAVVVCITVMWYLWFMAKKRGWEVRKSIQRMSRRVTGRFDTARSRRASAAAPKQVRLESQSPPRARQRDLEKGIPGTRVNPVIANNGHDRKAPPAPLYQNKAGRYPVASQQPSVAQAGAVQSKFEDDTPVVKSFREHYKKRTGGA